MKHFKLLDHTADIGIEAIAEDREGLAAQSGYGLKFLLFGELEAQPTRREIITASGSSAEETLVNWLNELLYLMSEGMLIPANIKVVHFTEAEIVAEIESAAVAAEQLREIKAVTHHQSEISHDGHCWNSKVYLDL